MKKVLIVLIITGIIYGEIFLISPHTDILLLLIIFLYLVTYKSFKLRSTTTFIISIYVLMAMFISLLIQGLSVSTERSAAWVFFLILTGVIQKIRE